MSNNPPVAIVGAGIGGLAAALAMLMRGVDVTVYEQAPELREVGAGIQISANGTRLLNALGLEKDLALTALEPAGKQIRLWNTGESWKLFDLGAVSRELYGAPYITMHRSDLHAILVQAIQAKKSDAIKLGYQCTDAEARGDRVSVHFKDRPSVSVAALVGADGLHSRVREAFFGHDEPQFTGCIAWRGMVSTDDLPDDMRKPVGTNWVGPGGHFVHYPVRSGKLLNFVGIAERDDWSVESWTVQGSADEFANDFRGWHKNIQTLIERTGRPFKWALKTRNPMPKWSGERVTLLGDACHASLPFLAQGAVMAIEDGFVLARAVEKYGDDYARAFRVYEEARKERTARVMRGSADNIKRFHDNRLSDASAAKRYVDEEWSEEKVKNRYEWLFLYRADQVAI